MKIRFLNVKKTYVGQKVLRFANEKGETIGLVLQFQPRSGAACSCLIGQDGRVLQPAEHSNAIAPGKHAAMPIPIWKLLRTHGTSDLITTMSTQPGC